MAILVVDDSEDVRDIFEAALTEGGYPDILMADSASAAFALLALDQPQRTLPVDVIFLDVVMPGVDGIEACARIRRDPRYAEVPIVMSTSVNTMEGVDKAFEHGATDYLTKPLKIVDLMACVRSNMRLKADNDRRNAIERELLQHKPFCFAHLPDCGAPTGVWQV